MNVIPLQVFVSLGLVAGALVLFLHSVRSHDFEHADRLSLAPLDDDTQPTQPTSPQPTQTDPESPCKQDESNTTTP